MEATQGFCLAAGVLLSLVLPLAGAMGRKSQVRAVWAGQCLMALGGLWIIVVPRHAILGLLFAAAACLAFLPVVCRQVREA